jgi:hypothetical protein
MKVAFRIDDASTYRWIEILSVHHNISDTEVVMKILEFSVCGLKKGLWSQGPLTQYGYNRVMEVDLPISLCSHLTNEYRIQGLDSEEDLPNIINGVLYLILNEYLRDTYHQHQRIGWSDQQIFDAMAEINCDEGCMWM